MSSSETEYEEIKPKAKKSAAKDEGVLQKLAEKRKGLVKKHKEEKGYTPQIFPAASAPAPAPAPPPPPPPPPQPTVNYDALAETRLQDLLKKAKDEIRAELAVKPKKPKPKPKKKAPVTSDDDEPPPPPRKKAPSVPPPQAEKLTGSLLLDALFFRK
jgi:hypothetical protein